MFLFSLPRRAKFIFSVIFPLVLTSACQTTDDPKQGGLMNAIHGINSGAYDRRIETRETQLQQEQGEYNELAALAERLQQERAQVAAELDRLSDRLASLDRSIAQSRSRIIREGNRSRTEKLQLQNAEKKLKQAQTDLKHTRQQQEVQPVEQVRDNTENLQKNIQELENFVKSLEGI
jgi:chromosome segregation ATPase